MDIEREAELLTMAKEIVRGWYPDQTVDDAWWGDNEHTWALVLTSGGTSFVTRRFMEEALEVLDTAPVRN